MISGIAAISQSLPSSRGVKQPKERYYLLSIWADGGNLREFWRENPSPNLDLTADQIMEVLVQLRGLTQALNICHNPTHIAHDARAENRFDENSAPETETDVPSSPKGPTINVTHVDANDHIDSPLDGSKWRHGDLKPDNILRVKKDRTWLGTLQLADLGLAKQHLTPTLERHNATTQTFGTAWYEAPEARDKRRPRSRLFDMWSMGCIIFETVIWLLYGEKGLSAFEKKGASIDDEKGTIYYSLVRGTACVNEVVSNLMSNILKHNPECNQGSGMALGDLLKVVRDQLLVVALPSPNAIGEHRIDSAMLRQELDTIIKKAKRNQRYLFTGTKQESAQLPLTPRGQYATASSQPQYQSNSSTGSSLLPVQMGAPSGRNRLVSIPIDLQSAGFIVDQL
jgi:serine/threonine protein kinase